MAAAVVANKRHRQDGRVAKQRAIEVKDKPKTKAQIVFAAQVAERKKAAELDKKLKENRERAERPGYHSFLKYFGYNPLCGQLEGFDDGWQDKDYVDYVASERANAAAAKAAVAKATAAKAAV